MSGHYTGLWACIMSVDRVVGRAQSTQGYTLLYFVQFHGNKAGIGAERFST